MKKKLGNAKEYSYEI